MTLVLGNQRSPLSSWVGRMLKEEQGIEIDMDRSTTMSDADTQWMYSVTLLFLYTEMERLNLTLGGALCVGGDGHGLDLDQRCLVSYLQHSLMN